MFLYADFCAYDKLLPIRPNGVVHNTRGRADVVSKRGNANVADGFQIGGVAKNVADHLHLIFSEVAVELWIAYEQVLCLCEFAVGGNEQAFALDSELRFLCKSVYM